MKNISIGGRDKDGNIYPPEELDKPSRATAINFKVGSIYIMGKNFRPIKLDPVIYIDGIELKLD